MEIAVRLETVESTPYERKRERGGKVKSRSNEKGEISHFVLNGPLSLTPWGFFTLLVWPKQETLHVLFFILNIEKEK